MANFEPWEITDVGDRGTAHGKITLVSNGWSGDVVKNDGTNNHFQFDVTGEGDYSNTHYTIEANGGYAFGGGGQIIGISLEHMGEITETSSGQKNVQFLGMANDSSDYIGFVPAWGALESDTDITVDHSNICVESITINENEYVDRPISQITLPYVYAGIRTLCDGNWYAVNADITIETDLPIFETDADLLAYCRSGGTDTSNILNPTEEPDPEEEYKNDQKYYKLKNLYARGGGSSWTPVKNVNYRIKPLGGKICLYKHKPTANAPYEWELYNYSGYDIWASNGITYDDNDDFSLISTPETEFLQNSIKIGNTSWRVNIFETDIPRWNSKQDADDYIAGLKDITECLNYDYIARTNQEILGPDIGLADVGDDNGTNGMVYSYGSRMYVMSSSHLAGFFADVFNTANINDILDGTKLFGTNQINAISGINYFPCTISEFCTVMSPGAVPHVGSWVCPTAVSNGYITQNNKLIDCGGDFLKPIYNDFRDLEPYQQLWVTLPFCGTHQLQLTKYLNKFISFKYSIDAVTGACSCHVYADGIELDTFDGVCASQRPITAIDQTTYLSNVIGSVNSALTSGVGVISSGAQAIGGVVTGDALSVVGGVGGMVGGGASGVLGAYNVMQAVDNPPMTTRGGSSGCLGFFGCTQIHLHFYQKKTVKPVHALMLCGAPSNVSGTVSSFGGFLKCSTFKMSDGFRGTNDELNEIMQLMKNGIYV